MGQMWSKIKLKEIGDRMHDFGGCNILFVDKHSHSLLPHPWSLSGPMSSLALGCSSPPSSHPTNALFHTIKAACIKVPSNILNNNYALVSIITTFNMHYCK